MWQSEFDSKLDFIHVASPSRRSESSTEVKATAEKQADADLPEDFCPSGRTRTEGRGKKASRVPKRYWSRETHSSGLAPMRKAKM